MDQGSGSEILAQSRPALDRRQAVAVFQPPGGGEGGGQVQVPSRPGGLAMCSTHSLFVEVVSEARVRGV